MDDFYVITYISNDTILTAVRWGRPLSLCYEFEKQGYFVLNISHFKQEYTEGEQ